MWNSRSLLRACEELMLREDTELRIARIKTATAHSEYEWCPHTRRAKNVQLVVDPAQSGLVEGFLHEALHAVLESEVGRHFNKPLEETLIRALERQLWVHSMRREDVTRWRKLINAKLR